MRHYLTDSLRVILILITIGSGIAKANPDVLQDSSAEKTLYIGMRLGQGGFSDTRSPIGKLGGGQLAFDLRMEKLPIGITLSGEYYTNSPGPTNPYEISSLTVFNVWYWRSLLPKERLNIYAGAGAGRMTVPQDSIRSVNSVCYNVEVGFHSTLLWKFGLYASYKFLYANKTDQIDFAEHIMLVGLIFNIGI